MWNSALYIPTRTARTMSLVRKAEGEVEDTRARLRKLGFDADTLLTLNNDPDDL